MAVESFGTRLRSLRERAGMSLTQLAEQVGTDQGNISAWERNSTLPEITMVERLSAVLGVASVELLTQHPADQPKRTIRLAADTFATHLSTEYATTLVTGLVSPQHAVDYDDWIVTKLLAWVELQSARSPDGKYEMSRLVAMEVLERLAGRK